MDRMACVELPAFPLQLLLKRHPGWTDRPVAVVDRDKPQGVVLWMNGPARAAGIRKGMLYAAGLSLARTLHAGEVPPADVEQGVADALARLRRFSPGVEPCRDEPGVFWLDASGLSHLYASLRQWADEIAAALRTGGLQAAAVVGFTRFGTYAIAKTVTAGQVAVVRDAARERVLAGQTPLERLGIDPGLRDSLGKLGVRTVRAFLQLPPAGLRRRFGPEAQRLHRLVADDLQVPLQPLRVTDPLSAQHYFDAAETDVQRLLFFVKRLLDRLLIAVVERHEQLAELTLHLRLDRNASHTEQIRPAAPTLDVGQLMNLVRPAPRGAGAARRGHRAARHRPRRQDRGRAAGAVRRAAAPRPGGGQPRAGPHPGRVRRRRGAAGASHRRTPAGSAVRLGAARCAGAFRAARGCLPAAGAAHPCPAGAAAAATAARAGRLAGARRRLRPRQGPRRALPGVRRVVAVGGAPRVLLRPDA